MQNPEASSIFDELNLYIQPLLNSIEQDLQCKSSNLQRLLDLRREQCALTQKLREKLVQICEKNSKHHVCRESIVAMEEFILLPLILISQRGQKRMTKNQASQTSYSNPPTMSLILQSTEFSCITEATQTISVMINFLSSVDHERAMKMENSTVKPQIIISCLISCTMAMQFVVENSATRDGALDQGDECQEAILQTIYCLLQPSISVAERNPSNMNNHSLPMHLAQAVQGTLIARCAEICISCMLPQNEKSTSSESEEKSVDYSKGKVGLQVQAIKTLQSLIKGVPFMEMWRSLFPGSFSGLFRSTLSSLNLSHSSPKLAELSLCTLSDLLVVAISQMNSEDTSTNFLQEIHSRLPGPINILLHLVSIHRSKKVREAGIQLCKTILIDTRDVWREKKVDIRDLQSLTIDYKNKRKKSEHEIITTAMESCLIFSGDEYESIAILARPVIAAFQSSFISEEEWRDHQNNIIAPRILQLIEELPALALSGREINLRNRLDLLNGYLLMILNFEKHSNGYLDKHGGNYINLSQGSFIGASLASRDISILIRKSVSVILELDFDTFTSYWHEKNNIPSNETNIQTKHTFNSNSTLVVEERKFSSSYTFVHLSSMTSVNSVIKFLRMLGSIYGTRRCALFIDECIADMFEELQQSADHGMVFHGKGQYEWARRRIGHVVMIKEMLLGCLMSNKAAHKEEQDPQFACDPDQMFHSMSLSSSTVEILVSLCQSLFPVLTDPLTWNLPTTSETVAISSEDEKCNRNFVDETQLLHDFFDSSLSTLKSITLHSKRRRHFRNAEFVEVSVSALHGNAHIMAQLLDLIGILSLALGDEVQSFLPTILFPLIQKSSVYMNHPHVKHVALKNIEFIAKSVGALDMSELFLVNFDYLVEYISTQFRTQNDESVSSKTRPPPTLSFISTLGVIETLLDYTFCKPFLKSQVSSCKKKSSSYISDNLELVRNIPSNHDLILLQSLVVSLLAHFDCNVASSMDASMSLYQKSILSMIRVLRVSLKSFRVSHPQALPIQNKDIPSSHDSSEELWLNRLCLSFEKAKNMDLCLADQDEGDYLTPYEGFTKFHASQSTRKHKNNHDLHSTVPPDRKEIVSRYMETVEEVVRRCSFFLCTPNLQASVAVCETLIEGFELLALASSDENAEMATKEKKVNFLLPCISEIWPTIKSRLFSTSKTIVTAQTSLWNSLRNQAIIATNTQSKHKPNQDISSPLMFLQSAFHLISSFGELAGDFMVDRFKSDVWPVMSKLINHFIVMKPLRNGKRQTNQSTLIKSSPVQETSKGERTEYCAQTQKDSFDSAIIAIFNCVTRLFSEHSIGPKLSHLIPEIGNIFLPFLSDEGQIGIASEAAVKSMLNIDPSTLLRGLYALSGEKLPINPLLESSRGEIQHNSYTPWSRAQYLIEHLDNQVEQVIF